MSKTFAVCLTLQLVLLLCSYCSAHVKIFSIDHKLTLDGSETIVKPAAVNSDTAQLWDLQAGDTGYFIIKNVKTGLVLDMEHGCKKGANLITYKQHNGTNQRFFINSDQTLGSACSRDLILVDRKQAIILSERQDKDLTQVSIEVVD